MLQNQSVSVINDDRFSVLRTLVEEYIGTALPVASESIARRSPVKVSPATVRNKMSDLEEEGYIIRPHISSGGIPLSKAYRFYIETLEYLEPTAQAKEDIKTRFTKIKWDTESRVRLAASILSDISGNMAFVTYPKKLRSRIKTVQLVLIQEDIALLIVVLEETSLKKHLIPLENPIDQFDLTNVANKLTNAFTGLTYREILEKSVDLTPFEATVTQGTLSILKNASENTNTSHAFNGLRLILNQPEFEKKGSAQEIVEILEDNLLVNTILSDVPEDGDVSIRIGEEIPEESLQRFGIVLGQYGIPADTSGVIAVIGPTRMEYANVIGSVRFLSSFMGDLITPSNY